MVSALERQVSCSNTIGEVVDNLCNLALCLKKKVRNTITHVTLNTIRGVESFKAKIQGTSSVGHHF